MSDLSPAQIAEQTGASLSAVRRAIAGGEFPNAYKFRGRVKVPAADLDDFRARNRLADKPVRKLRSSPRRARRPADTFRRKRLAAIEGGRG